MSDSTPNPTTTRKDLSAMSTTPAKQYYEEHYNDSYAQRTPAERGLRLVRIEHERCDETEYGQDTYLWIPAEMTDEQLQDAADRASDTYLANEQRWEARPDRPASSWSPDFAAHPDMLVRDVIAAHEAAKEQAAAWRELQDAARRSFAEILQDEIPAACPIDSHRLEPNARVYWGHQHGTTIDYGATDISAMTGPVRTIEEDPPRYTLRRRRASS